MDFIKNRGRGILLCFCIALPAWLLGKKFPVIGGAIIAILAGLLLTMCRRDAGKTAMGVKWTSKYILQAAVVLLGFGMEIAQVNATALQHGNFGRRRFLYLRWLCHCGNRTRDWCG